ncbi:sulfotransferase family protein [Methyloprofundus sp.]|uniref:sulfotransferase family protein n=1 Tax=Methyloprofundus sp. TaxID=2020875 RepID=UPI003D0BD828
MTKKKKRLVVVLGMHRSGTSVVTRGLKVLNVQLGKGLLPPVKGVNEKGYWEDKEIYLFNTEMLAQFGRDWSNLAEISPIEVKILHQQGFFLRAVELLRKKTNDTPIFGFKDPRTTKLLPFWKDVFDHLKFDVSYVMVIRHPLSVVKSLAKRDDFPEEQSYLLWLGHVIPSLIGSNGSKRVLVDFDTLMNSPEHEITRIAEFLDLKVKPDALRIYTNKFISENLRHTIYYPNDLLIADSAPPIVQEIYTALLDVATDKLKLDDIELQNKLTLWSDEFDRLKSPLALLDKLFCQKKELREMERNNHPEQPGEMVKNHFSNDGIRSTN